MIRRSIERKSKGESYWALTVTGAPVEFTELNSGMDDKIWAWGNYYDTREDAMKASQELSRTKIGTVKVELQKMKVGESLVMEPVDMAVRSLYSQAASLLKFDGFGIWKTHYYASMQRLVIDRVNGPRLPEITCERVVTRKLPRKTDKAVETA